MSTPAAEAFRKTRQQYVPPTHTALGLRELNHADRCDQCGAQAYARTEALDTTLPLLWCAHHFTENEHHFPTTTHAILDERPHLLAAVKAQASYADGDAK